MNIPDSIQKYQPESQEVKIQQEKYRGNQPHLQICTYTQFHTIFHVRKKEEMEGDVDFSNRLESQTSCKEKGKDPSVYICV